jgi:hypothetical protein
MRQIGVKFRVGSQLDGCLSVTLFSDPWRKYRIAMRTVVAGGIKWSLGVAVCKSVACGRRTPSCSVPANFEPEGKPGPMLRYTSFGKRRIMRAQLEAQSAGVAKWQTHRT